MPSKFEKSLKKAVNQVGKAVDKAAHQADVNARHLNDNLQKAVIKNIDLGEDRRRARDAKEMFEKNAELTQAIAPNGTFDKTIAEATLEITAAKAKYDPLALKVTTLNLKEERIAELNKELSTATACITASESTLSELKKSKEDILNTIKFVNERYYFIQQAPEKALENDKIIAEAKKAAEEVVAASNRVIKLYEEAKLTTKLATLKEFLQKVLPLRLLSTQTAYDKLTETLNIEAKAAIEKAAAEKAAAEKAAAENNASSSHVSGMDTKFASDNPEALQKQFEELQARQRREMDELIKRMQSAKVASSSNTAVTAATVSGGEARPVQPLTTQFSNTNNASVANVGASAASTSTNKI